MSRFVRRTKGDKDDHDRTDEFGVKLHGTKAAFFRDPKIVFCACGGPFRFTIGEFGQSLVKCDRCGTIKPLAMSRS